MEQLKSGPAEIELNSPTPNFWRETSFFIRSNGLRALRAIKDHSRTFDVPRHGTELLPAFVAESVTPLRYALPEEKIFEEGKIKNLRAACARITGLIVEPSGEFSFWRAVGRPSRANGFVVGREIREGCLVPTVGGGLCQLSGSLYSVAAQAGLTILERHGHTRRLRDAYFHESRDATVFWNYVDLRFAAATRFQLETFLTESDLVVRLRADQPTKKTPRTFFVKAAMPQPVSDCLTCGQHDCHQHHRSKDKAAGKQVLLANRLSPEFGRFLRGQLTTRSRALSADHQVLPLDGTASIAAKTFPWARLKRSAVSRFGSKRKVAAWARIAGASILANCYEREMAKRSGDYLFIDQELLPHLWLCGALAGRKYCVLASRLPSSTLQARLDALYARYPDRESLREFRMEPAYWEAEDQALQAADRIVSAHEEIIQSVSRCERLDWENPGVVDVGTTERDSFLFPGITAAREGAYEVRAAALELGFKLITFERNIERAGFWDGVDVTFCSAASIPWARISALIHPAVFVSSPRVHLRAIASGIPVVASRGCGLSTAQVVDVEAGSTEHLIAKIQCL